MEIYKLPYNNYYGFKIIVTSNFKPLEVCRCHDQTMAEKVGLSLFRSGIEEVRLLHRVGRSWQVCGSWGNAAASKSGCIL